MRHFAICSIVGIFSGAARAETPAHVAAVREAQKSAYAISDATNSCPTIATDLLGWPAATVRRCICVEGWLDVVKREMLAAINGSENRLLEAWVAAHSRTIGSSSRCPGDNDP